MTDQGAVEKMRAPTKAIVANLALDLEKQPLNYVLDELEKESYWVAKELDDLTTDEEKLPGVIHIGSVKIPGSYWAAPPATGHRTRRVL